MSVRESLSMGHCESVKKCDCAWRFMYILSACSCNVDYRILSPESYYLHTVCQSCYNLTQGIVLQEHYIVFFYTLMRKVSKEVQCILGKEYQRALKVRIVYRSSSCPVRVLFSSGTWKLRGALLLWPSSATGHQ